jgi:uncharacterized protein YhaN
MRIDVLELVRYGHFSERRLAFEKSGSSDLHIVFGPNEAGKSTIREGIGDILFKVPMRSKMNFAAGAALRIGGRFSEDGQSFEVYRLKKNKDDLVDADDVPVRVNPFAAVTNGFVREFFDQTFSVDRSQLEDGAKQILEGKGDLGQLLFAGSTGLQGLPERLSALDQAAARLWRSKGGAEIKTLIDQIADIDKKIKEIRTTQSDHDDAVRTEKHAQTAYDAILARRGVHVKSVRESETWLRAFGPFRDRQRAHKKLEGLGTGESAEARDLERVRSALRDFAGFEASLNTAKLTSAGLEARLEALPHADPITAHVGDIEDLRDRAVEARKERKDRPNREREADEARATIRRVIGELGLDPEAASRDLTIATPVTARLNGLLTEEAELRSASRQAAEEVARAETAVADAEHAMDGLGSDVDPSELKSILKSGSQEDLSAEFRRLSGERARCIEKQQAIFAAHSIVGEDAVAVFLALRLPDDAELDRLGAAVRDAERSLAEISADVRAGLQALETAEQDLAALSGVQDISDEALLQAKADRDAVVGALTWPIDEVGLSQRRSELESGIGKTDRIYDERIDQADALSGLAVKTTHRDREALKVSHLESKKAAAETALSAAREAVRSVSPGGMVFRDVAHIRAVVMDRRDARQIKAEIGGLDRQLELITDQQARQDEMICSALLKLGFAVDSTHTGGALRAFAQDRLDEIEERNRKRQASEAALRSAKQDLARRQRDIASHTEAGQELDRAFRETIAETWIDLETGVESVRQVLNRLPELLRAQGDLQTAMRRLEAMDQNHHNGLKLLERLRPLLDPDGVQSSDADDFIPLTEALVLRLTQAQKRDQDEVELKSRLADANAAIDKARAGLAETNAGIADLQQKFGKTVLDDLWTSIQNGIERAKAHAEMDRYERDLMTTLNIATPAAAETIMSGLDQAELLAQKDALEVELEAIEGEREAAWNALMEAKRALERMTGSDDIARLLQERESVKSELADLVQDYTRLRAGEAVLGWALTRFRQTNKAPMLTTAARFFERMTGGEYIDLITQPGDKGDVLAAKHRDGGVKGVDELSEGTRHQLFLALRMAGYLELSKGRGVPPLILDDILSSSDDTRAAAMLEALADLAKAAQVIVLTHHAHVLDIADKAVPGRFTIHRLTEATG